MILLIENIKKNNLIENGGINFASLNKPDKH